MKRERNEKMSEEVNTEIDSSAPQQSAQRLHAGGGAEARLMRGASNAPQQSAQPAGLSKADKDEPQSNNPDEKAVQNAGSDAGEIKEDVEDSAPEAYDFKDVELPEGMELDAELTEEFSSIAKEMNLSQAKADKFMGMGVKLSQKIQQNFENAIKEAQVNRIKEIKTMLNTDPEIGGANLKSTLLEANESYKTFVSDEAANVLAETGLNNHPAIVKMFRDIGRQIKGDTVKGSGSPQHQRTAEDWYPSMKKDR